MLDRIKNDRPLHEVVLEIMFKISPEKPVYVTVTDVLWNIDDQDMTERDIKEVMEWLVRQRHITRYLDKYCLDRITYLELKKSVDIDRQFYKKIRPGLVIIPALLALILSIFTLYQIGTSENIVAENTQRPERVKVPENDLRKLYLNKQSEPDEETIKQISYNFYLQHNNNRMLQSKIGVLEQMDSVIFESYVENAEKIDRLMAKLEQYNKVQLQIHYYVLAIAVTIMAGFTTVYFQNRNIEKNSEK